MKRKGICFVCACTEFDACDEEGCAWADRAQTLCTACVDLSDAERDEKRKANLVDLAMRLELLEDEKRELQLRRKMLEGPAPKRTKKGARVRG